MPAKIKATKGNLSLGLLILIFVVLAAGILVAGHFFYSSYAKNYRTQVEHQLSAIADLKVGELVQWRKERLADANLLYKNPAFSSLVQGYFEHPDDLNAQEQLRSWLTKFQAYDQYASIFLLDTQGVGRIFAPDTAEPVPRHIPPDAHQVLQSGKVTILDLHRDEDNQQPYMAILIPIFKEKDSNVPLGVVVMRIDPYQYLYPLIQKWPTPSTTAETLIVRRDGNDALFLNELKFQKDTALKLRIPLEQKDVSAVKAALGEQGIVEGRDYRGKKVIADLRHIPDSPWFMVARIDTAEVYAPLTQMLWVVIALVGALLIGAGASVGLIWRRQNILVYKEKAEAAEALIDSEARYRELFENASLAIFRSTLEGKVLTVNPKFASMFGYKSQEEVVATVKDIATDLYADPHRREEIVRLKQANPDLNIFEVLYRRKDGSTFGGELTLNIITDSDGATFLEGFIEDITERKQAEETLRQEKQFSESLVDTAQMIVLVLNTSGQIVTFNPYMEEVSGYKLEESIGKDWFSTFLPEAKQAETRNIFSIAITDRKTKGNIDEIVTKDGRILSIEWYDKTLKDITGNIVGLLAVGQDITERRISSEKLAKSYESVKKTLNDAINTMVKIVELRDPYTAGHQQKVADLATAIAREMELDDTRIDQLRTAAVIHDIGKIYIPSDILSRPGRLTDMEFNLIKTHSQNGYDIVKSMDFPCNVAKTVIQHHERLDGSGYPNQLKSEDTLLEAKILAVADVIEAMASHRPYRQALGIDKALEEISKNRGKLYDPDVVDTCLELFKSGKFEFKAV